VQGNRRYLLSERRLVLAARCEDGAAVAVSADRLRIRITRQSRHLGCGCYVLAGSTIVSKGRSWLCQQHQPWLRLRTVEQVLAEERDRSE
jgi:hypothetical protein